MVSGVQFCEIFLRSNRVIHGHGTHPPNDGLVFDGGGLVAGFVLRISPSIRYSWTGPAGVFVLLQAPVPNASTRSNPAAKIRLMPMY